MISATHHVNPTRWRLIAVAVAAAALGLTPAAADAAPRKAIACSESGDLCSEIALTRSGKLVVRALLIAPYAGRLRICAVAPAAASSARDCRVRKVRPLGGLYAAQFVVSRPTPGVWRARGSLPAAALRVPVSATSRPPRHRFIRCRTARVRLGSGRRLAARRLQASRLSCSRARRLAAQVLRRSRGRVVPPKRVGGFVCLPRDTGGIVCRKGRATVRWRR